MVLFFTDPEANPEATAVYSRSGAARHPPCFSWRSSPTQSQLGASSLAYRRTALMRRAFLWSGPPGPSAQASPGERVPVGYLLPLWQERAQLAARRPPQSEAMGHKTSTVRHMVWSAVRLSRIDEAATTPRASRQTSAQARVRVSRCGGQVGVSAFSLYTGGGLRYPHIEHEVGGSLRREV